MSVRLAASLIALVVMSQACNKAQRYEDERMGKGPEGSAGTPSATRADSMKAPDTSAKMGAPATAGAGSSAEVAMGDSIFHGRKAGGTCQTCHGADGKGTTLAPDLTDNQWINTDGTLNGIESTIKTGVAKPKKHAGVMPPMGGSKLTDDQLHAVAQYVLSLSHK